mmetsp:Transcript_14641/g.24361  ORF Transcript_14641/g.24361 Transcript_14641/m.24361 type:complete len:207 (-) Transcript_14641:186-806(-)
MEAPVAAPATTAIMTSTTTGASSAEGEGVFPPADEEQSVGSNALSNSSPSNRPVWLTSDDEEEAMGKARQRTIRLKPQPTSPKAGPPLSSLNTTAMNWSTTASAANLSQRSPSSRRLTAGGSGASAAVSPSTGARVVRGPSVQMALGADSRTPIPIRGSSAGTGRSSSRRKSSGSGRKSSTRVSPPSSASAAATAGGANGATPPSS